MAKVLERHDQALNDAVAEQAAVSVRGVSKSFGDLQAVKDVSFTIRQGEVFSLLGPNGAGKSTLINILTGLLAPTEGDAQVMGHSIRTDPMQVKRLLGVVPQDIALYPDLSARENLLFWGRMFGLQGADLDQRVKEILSVVGLTERQRDRVGTFSGGMKRRLNIAAALLHDPRVVVMDEPTVGIDPQSRRAILDHVKTLNQQGTTVLYTTHYMEEAQELSDRLAIMDQGKLIAEGTHEDLVRIVGEQDRIALQLDDGASDGAELFGGLDGVSSIHAEDGHVVLLANDSDELLPVLFERAAARGVRITSMEVQEPNLEAVFLHLTGRALRE